MQIITDNESFIPTFEGEIPFCRDINDRLILFERSGEVRYLRAPDSSIGIGSNFYNYMPQSEVQSISDFCMSFDYDCLIIDTYFGTAAVFTCALGACSLMFAVISTLPKGAVAEYFKSLGTVRILISDTAGAQILSSNEERHIASVKETFTLARAVFETAFIRASIYKMGVRVGGFIAERLLDIANFVGCVGSCKTELRTLPTTENFCPEIFISLCVCVTAFAREVGTLRSFNACIGESAGRILTVFRIEVTPAFKPYKYRSYVHPALKLCDEITSKRDIFFDCFKKPGTDELFISFITESDPLIVRTIKQDVEKLIQSFHV